MDRSIARIAVSDRPRNWICGHGGGVESAVGFGRLISGVSVEAKGDLEANDGFLAVLWLIGFVPNAASHASIQHGQAERSMQVQAPSWRP